MQRGVLLSLIGLSSCLLACSSPLSSKEVLELGQAEARWAARPFQAYSFEYQISCGLCPYIFVRMTRVSVNNGQVVGVVFVANDSALSPQDRAYFPTIDTLFAQIRREAKDNSVKDLKVEFDPELGYPTVIRTISDPYFADAAGATYISNLVPTP